MISHLHGIIEKLDAGEVAVDVNGVGYRVNMPMDTWDALGEKEMRKLWISTYVREDRLELYGFPDLAGRILFEELTKISGIGPKLGLELCGVPRSILSQAVMESNVSLLTSIKGIGKKTAEKLLLELRSLAERKPGLLAGGSAEAPRGAFDQDAISALTSLGYDSGTAIKALKDLPSDIRTTEDRVAAALRSL